MERLQILTEEIGKMLNLRDEEIQADSKSISVLAATIEKVTLNFKTAQVNQYNGLYATTF